MMAADSLHVAVPLIVPSSMSFQWLLPCRRACSAGAFAPRLAQHPAQPSSVQRLASNAPGLRPLARRRAGCKQRSAAGPPTPGATARAKAEGKTKGFGTLPPAKPVCTWGGAARRASPPCRVGREARADAGMSACFARSDTPELAGSTAMTDRGDHDFWVRLAPKNRGKVGPELRFQGAQAGWQGQRRQVGGAPSYRWRERPARRPAARLTADAAIRRRASQAQS